MPSAAAFDLAKARSVVWVVVVTKPFQEMRAKLNLEAQGFEVYLPLKLFEIARGPRKGEVASTPFLPRYLFTRIDVREDQWRRVWSTTGCQSLLGSTVSRPPYGVRDFVIERIQAQEEAGYIRMMGETAKAVCPFGEGEVVRMAGSPLEVIFLEPVDSKRASILVSLLGRDHRLTVDIAELRSTAP